MPNPKSKKNAPFFIIFHSFLLIFMQKTHIFVVLILVLVYWYREFIFLIKRKREYLMSTPLDPKVIGKLAEILDKNNLTGIEYEDENCHITLSRNIQVQATTMAAPQLQPVISHPSTTAISPTLTPVANTTATPSTETDYSNNPNTVKSPMVGVVYLSPDPNSANYVKAGDSIKEGDIVCLIEAMKTFNPVKAHKNGTVTKILVEGGDPVEFGEPLVVIE